MITEEDIDRCYEELNAPNIHKDDNAHTVRRTEQMMRVMDPSRMEMPALTTLLFRVCGNNHETFERATQLIEKFMDEAEKDALEFIENQKKG